MFYKIYENRYGRWCVDCAKKHPDPTSIRWEFLECFPFRWVARWYVRKQLKSQPVPEERFVEIW